MLFFIGLGIEQSLTEKSSGIIGRCDCVFYESYTSPVLNPETLDNLSKKAKTNAIVQSVKREFVEDGRKILETALGSEVALVCSGDPMVATTHQDLRARAIKRGIQTKILHGSSIVCSVGGELGLHSYNFGRIVTMTKGPMQHTACTTVFRNLLQGLHTIILLEWDESNNFFLEPAQASRALLEAENDLKLGAIDPETLVFVASRLGRDDSALRSTTLGKLSDEQIGSPPHVLVLPGRLHFTEKESLSAIFVKSTESFPDNSSNIRRLSKQMVERYSEKTLRALERAQKAAKASTSKANFSDVFENVECYTQDALRFLNEGRDELAVLSIGYAEGLLDSLRFSGQLDFEW